MRIKSSLISYHTKLSENQISRGVYYSATIVASLCALTWIATLLDIDLKVAALFYSEDSGWIYQHAQPWRALYEFGTFPGLILTLLALSFLFLSGIAKGLKKYRKPLIIVVLTAIIGAGILVNGIIKPYCGRPRPREIVAFSGQLEHRSPCFKTAPGKGLSFPCGHCTMSFLFFSLIYFRRQFPKLAYGGAAFGLFFGILMGIARAAQGAHFVTDTLWSFGVLFIVSTLLNDSIIPLFEKSGLRLRAISRGQTLVLGLGLVIIMSAITLSFLTRRPFLEMTTQPLRLPQKVNQIVVTANTDFVKSSIRYEDNKSTLGILGQGFGLPNAMEKVTVSSEIVAGTLHIEIELDQKGYFAELHHQLFITLPLSYKNQVTVDIAPWRD